MGHRRLLLSASKTNGDMRKEVPQVPQMARKPGLWQLWQRNAPIQVMKNQLFDSFFKIESRWKNIPFILTSSNQDSSIARIWFNPISRTALMAACF